MCGHVRPSRPMASPTLKDRVLALVSRCPGLTDREIADRLLGRAGPQQGVNVVARSLAANGLTSRASRADGLIGNYPAAARPAVTTPAPSEGTVHRTDLESAALTNREPGPAARTLASSPLAARPFLVEPWPAEDQLKSCIKDYLEADGWRVTVMWGRDRGVDIDAVKGPQRWLFEVKGDGGTPQKNGNYFLGMLGETLQRMSDSNARYSIVMPDIPRFRGLWERLPRLAKERTSISAFFVAQDGSVDQQA